VKKYIDECANECLETLRRCQQNRDNEVAHVEADEALLTFISAIGFPEIKTAFDAIEDKWCA